LAYIDADEQLLALLQSIGAHVETFYTTSLAVQRILAENPNLIRGHVRNFDDSQTLQLFLELKKEQVRNPNFKREVIQLQGFENSQESFQVLFT
jgi:hypothetical protein